MENNRKENGRKIKTVNSIHIYLYIFVFYLYNVIPYICICVTLKVFNFNNIEPECRYYTTTT